MIEVGLLIAAGGAVGVVFGFGVMSAILLSGFPETRLGTWLGRRVVPLR